MTRETYYQRHKDVILKEQKDYYENDKKKKRLREQAKTKYRELPEEEKNIEVMWKKQIS